MSVFEHGAITVEFVVDRGISHELVRHRLFAFSQESTRYCNYGKDKFDNEVKVIKPEDLTSDQENTWLNGVEFSEKLISLY
jgi:thymidylate synthase (FAD)